MSLISIIKREHLQRELNQAEFDQNMQAIIQLQSLFWTDGVALDSIKLNGKLPDFYASKAELSTAIANLVDSSPEALDTLNELATALGNDPNFAATVTTALGNRLRVDVNNQGLTAQQKTNAQTNIGLTSLDDISDSATRKALTTLAQTIEGIKTFSEEIQANSGVNATGKIIRAGNIISEGTVSGADAINNNDFVTKLQLVTETEINQNQNPLTIYNNNL